MNPEDENVTEEERFDYEEFLDALDEYLDSTPQNYDNRFQKWFRIFFHSVLTLATGGLYIFAFTGYVLFYKFYQREDLDKYRETVLVKEEKVE